MGIDAHASTAGAKAPNRQSHKCRPEWPAPPYSQSSHPKIQLRARTESGTKGIGIPLFAADQLRSSAAPLGMTKIGEHGRSAAALSPAGATPTTGVCWAARIEARNSIQLPQKRRNLGEPSVHPSNSPMRRLPGSKPWARGRKLTFCNA